MSKYYAFLFFIFTNVSSYAQCDSSFFRYTGTKMYDVSVINPNTIVGVGENEYVLKSVDGGNTWKNIRISGTGYRLTAVQFASQNIGYTVDNDGSIFKTEDQGENWFPVYTNTALHTPFSDLYFFNDDKGFALGKNGHLLSTNDGGISWSDTLLSFFGDLNSINFFNDSLGFVTGSGNLFFRTTNGGKTWTTVNISNIGSGINILKLKMASVKIGYAVGNNIALKTTDGGVTWSRLTIDDQDYYEDLYVYSTNDVFIVGGEFGGLILHSSNGGKNWQANRSLLYIPPLSAIAADSSGKKIVITGGGNDGGKGRSILYSIDSGTTWTGASMNDENDIGDIQFINDSTGFMGSTFLGYKTSDYGESWELLQPIPSAYDVQSLSFIDTLNGYIATAGYSAGNLIQTTNGGKTWIKRNAPGFLASSTDKIKFINSSTGFFTSYGVLYRTADSGLTWKKILNSSETVLDYTFLNGKKGFAVCSLGKVYTSKDSGKTWQSFNLNTLEWLSSVYFYNDSIGFIGTRDSSIFKTVDGGASWTKIDTYIYNLQILSFHFTDKLNGYLIGNNNYGGITDIYKTKDGGLTWYFVTQADGNFKNITGFKTIYLAGEGGQIIRTDTLTIPSIPGYIQGPDESCVGEVTGYSVINIPNDSLIWNLNNGGTYTKSESTIEVTWKQKGLHKVSVAAQNVCGTGAYREKTVDVILFKPVIMQLDSALTVTSGLAYQWYYNDTLIPAAKGGTQKNLLPDSSGYYKAEVVSDHGCTRITDSFYYASVLPVRIVSFNGSIINENDAQLKWVVTDEENLDHFNLQRSIDGIHYLSIARINKMKGSDLQAEYTYVDKNVNNIQASKIYYKLAEVDKDGKSYLSNIVSIKLNSVLLTAIVSPNPSSGTVCISLSGFKGKVIIRVNDLSGRALREIKLQLDAPGKFQQQLNISAIASGSYFMKVRDEHGNLKTVQFAIQR
ncbi:MAG TPA: YCF48-related protein [Parafilimonas sp.]|nr:YCF48-related protein [Parafilimonas sp.]